jgi:serine phosphatase RsbU (regulator of sigma subunit)
LARQLQDLRSELETARKIQLSILPREFPKTDQLDITARYIPASAVAGDFYDFFAVDERRVGVLVADVSGHGMPAALIASMLKIAFATQRAHASDPAAVITGLNQALCGKFEGHFVTAAYALIDTETRTLRYAGAGHPPLLLRDAASGKTRPISENGLFLGFLPRAEYNAIETDFQPGDVVLLYTDGIPEATKGATEDEFGEGRLEEFLDNCDEGSAAGLADSLLSALSSWTGEKEPADDITLVAVRFSE